MKSIHSGFSFLFLMQGTEMTPSQDPQLYFHIRIVMGMVLGLTITRLLSGTAKCFQNPKKYGLSLLHMGWVFALFSNAILFWWWEFNLIGVGVWTFESYLFVILYTGMLYFSVSFIFPEELSENYTFYKFFVEKKIIFFSILQIYCILSIVDVYIKGDAYVDRNMTYVMFTSLSLMVLFGIASFVDNIKYQAFVMLAFLAVQVTGIVWLLHTIH